MKRKIPYIVTCVQCPAFLRTLYNECLHEHRRLTKEESIYIPDWCPLDDKEEDK